MKGLKHDTRNIELIKKDWWRQIAGEYLIILLEMETKTEVLFQKWAQVYALNMKKDEQ